MVDVAEAQRLDDDASLVAESDFSPRKLKIATGILIGQVLATSLLPFSAVSLLLIPMTTEFHWSRTQYSLGTAFLFFFGAVSLWPIGRMADKFGTKPVILIGSTIVGLITLAMAAQTNSVTQLCVLYALLGMFGSTGVAYSKLIAGLFTQNRGIAMAILGAESTVAFAVVPIVANYVMLRYGWRDMYLVFGAVILAIVPVLFFLLEEPVPPKKDAEAPKAITAPTQVDGMTIGEALKDYVFWLITFNALLGLVVLVGMAPHMVPAIIGKGFSQTTAVWMTSVAMLVGLGGNVVGGILVDRVHSAKVGVPFALISALGAVLLLNVTSTFGGVPMLMIAVGLGGFSMAAARPMGTYFQTRFFGLRSFTEIVAVQFTFTNVITSFSPGLVGQIYDRTHSYQIAFYLMIIVPLISAVIWLILPRYRYSANIGQTMVKSKD
jgi:MFS family permease